MRKSPAAAVAALLIVFSLALAGCSTWFENPAKPANDAITTANTHMKKAMAAGALVTDAAGLLESIPYTTAGTKQALELTAKIKNDLAIEKTEFEAAKAAMDSIAALEVDEEYKAYAKLESTAIGTRVRVVELGVKLYAEMDKLYVAVSKGKTGSPEMQQIVDGIDAVKRDITAVSELAAQQSQAALDYFNTKKLGG